MRLVVLGTGTDVGKTFVTSQLAAALQPLDRVLALKPIESGVDPDATGDAGAIARSAGHPALLSAWRFSQPVSPHLAAREAGASIDLTQVVSWIAEQERLAAPRVTLIETAGGALSPLGRGLTNADLAAALEPAIWLLVAPDSLGVLHDLTATLCALPRRPDAVVLSSARPADASSGRNAQELRDLGISEVLATLARGSSEVSSLVAWLRSRPSYKAGQ